MIVASTRTPQHPPEAIAASAYVPTVEDLSLGVERPWLVPQTLALAALVSIATIAAAASYYTPLTTAVAAVQGGIAVLLAARYLRVRPPRLPWIEIVYAIQFVEWGVAITIEPTPVGILAAIPSSESHEAAAIVAALSGLAMLGAFALGRLLLARRWQQNPLLPKLDPASVAAGSVVLVPMAAAYTLSLSYFPSIEKALLPIAGATHLLFGYSPLLIVPSLAYLTLPGTGTRLRLIFALVAIGACVAATSMLNTAVVPLLGLATLWWRARERIPVLPVAAAVGVLLILQPVKSYYRQIQWTDHAGMNVVDAWSQAFSMAEQDARSGYVKTASGSEATLQRLNALSTHAYILDTVPGSIPHGGGEVYEVLTYAFIPRFVWPEKPNMTDAGLNRYAIAIGLTTRDVAETSTTGISLVTQGHYEHGIPGSLAWMALLGATLALLTSYFGSSLAGTLAGATMLFTWITSIEGGFFNTYGSLPQTLIVVTALAWIIKLTGGIVKQWQPRANMRRGAARPA